ncbi:MAG: hypothetical protein RSG07_06140 [Erysipelotrichaceae bacterium]
MKKIASIMLVVCLMFITTGCGNDSKEPSNQLIELTKLESSKKDMVKYTLLEDKEHVFVETSYEQLNKLFANKGTGVIYLGGTGCPWCEECVPVLNDVAKKYKGLNIYCPKSITKEDDEAAFKKQYEIFNNNVLPGEEVVYIPHVFVIVEGKVVADNLGTVDGHDAHTNKMTAEQITKLDAIYTGMLDKLVKK